MRYAALVGSLALAAGTALAAELTVPPFPSGATAEIEAALAAAPQALRADASVWVTGPQGYSQAVGGTNGVTCLVGREDGGGWAPICWDREGTETILPVVLEEERLRQAGKSAAEVQQAIDAGFRSGRFRAPRRAGVSWMLSAHNYVDAGGRIINYHPHVMIYAPYLTNAEVHGDPRNPALPWVLFEGTPHAYLIVDARAVNDAGAATGH
jgi:hypothetical protein